MIDRDLAVLYSVETKRLKKAVKRNIFRFPVDFMVELWDAENDSMRSQFANSKNQGRGGTRFMPMVFIEF